MERGNSNSKFLLLKALMLYLFRYKTFYKNSFSHFSVFGSIKKKIWSIENYL